MAKDYKLKETSDTSGNAGNYTWMLSGIALGLLIGLGMYFYSSNKLSPATNEPDSGATAAADSQQPDPISVVIDNARREQQETQRASFSYYAVLPNLELDVDVKPAATDAPAPVTEPVELKPGSHLLQLASFRSEAQAKTMITRLAQDGMAASIEKKAVRGKTWYRVFMGPTEDQKLLNQWLAQAQSTGLKPLIVKAQ